jgi:hypothetical protein
MAWETETSRMKARRARRASPTVKPMEAALCLAYFCCLLLCNLFQTPKSLCKEYYLLIWNISFVYHIVAMRVIKHRGHTHGGFGSMLFRTGVWRKDITVYWYNPYWVRNAVFGISDSRIFSWWYPDLKSIFENTLAPFIWLNRSSIRRRGYLFLMVTSFNDR